MYLLYGFLLVSSRRIYACIHESLFWVIISFLNGIVLALNEIGLVGELIHWWNGSWWIRVKVKWKGMDPFHIRKWLE